MSQAISGTYHQVPVGGRTGTGKRWSDAGLLFVQQFYFPASEEKRLYDAGVYWATGFQSASCRIWKRCWGVKPAGDAAGWSIAQTKRGKRFWMSERWAISLCKAVAGRGGTCKSKQKEDGTGRNHPFAARGGVQRTGRKGTVFAKAGENGPGGAWSDTGRACTLRQPHRRTFRRERKPQAAAWRKITGIRPEWSVRAGSLGTVKETIRTGGYKQEESAGRRFRRKRTGTGRNAAGSAKSIYFCVSGRSF